MRFWLCLLLGVNTLNLAARANTGASIGIVGDSISTGAVTSPALVFDESVLWKIFNGTLSLRPVITDLPHAQAFQLTDPIAPPTRLWPSIREFHGSLAWTSANLLSGFSRLYLDTEEYSWGYLVGRKLGVAPANILIAAEDGARVITAVRQMDRLLNTTGGRIPNKVFLFFTGNDLCGPTVEMITSSQIYGESLRTALTYLVRNGVPAAAGSELVILSPLSILQLVDSPDILAKKVRAHGREMTCRELQQYRGDVAPIDNQLVKETPEAAYFFQFFPKSPAAYCSNLFSAKDGSMNAEHVMILANRLRAFRQVASQVVQDLNGKWSKQFPEGKLRARFIEATSGLQFNGEDIANDCFHLSAAGQAKIATQVLQGL